jgi:hypothetical protein
MTTDDEYTEFKGGDMPERWNADGNGLDYHFWMGCNYHQHARLYEQTKRVAWSWSIGGDEPEFAWIVELKDGRFVLASGGHDYTGWDCISHFEVCHVAATEIECAQYLTDRPRYLDGQTLKPQTQPMHASFITLLSHDPKQIRTFAALGRELGDVVNVHGY